MFSLPRQKWLLALLVLLVPAVWLFALTPVHDGEWLPGHARLPEISIGEDTLTIRHLRDFRYHPDGRIREARYRQLQLSLDSLQQVWLGISHFADNGLAHTFLSFEFADGQSLVASVEARMRPGQDYHPLPGILRQYHKIIVLGTEQDIIGLRSYIRGERVLFYPLTLNAKQQQHLLRGMMHDVQAISQQATFYNTLLDNCTTSLLRHDPRHRPWHSLLDYRILLPGHADAYARERGWISTQLPLARQRAELAISSAIPPDSSDFSRRIRLPNYQQLSLALLVLQQEQHHLGAVRTHGIVRGLEQPRHYWIEDHRQQRIGLEPLEVAAPYLGKQVEVTGRFRYQRDRGRSIELDSIQTLPVPVTTPSQALP